MRSHHIVDWSIGRLISANQSVMLKIEHVPYSIDKANLLVRLMEAAFSSTWLLSLKCYCSKFSITELWPHYYILHPTLSITCWVPLSNGQNFLLLMFQEGFLENFMKFFRQFCLFLLCDRKTKNYFFLVLHHLAMDKWQLSLNHIKKFWIIVIFTSQKFFAAVIISISDLVVPLVPGQNKHDLRCIKICSWNTIFFCCIWVEVITNLNTVFEY